MVTVVDAVSAPGVYTDSVLVDATNVMALTEENFRRAQTGGLSAMVYTAVRPYHELPDALRDLARVRETVDANPHAVLPGLRAADVRDAKESGRLAVILALQDPKPIGDDATFLRTLADLSVRVIQLTHNTQNYIGTGCIEPDQGLTRFGRYVVGEMNRLGILVDVGHCGPKTSMHAAEVSERPIISSHANPKTIAGSPRNKTDEVMKRIAERGGVVGIASWSPMTYRGGGKRPTLSDVLDCFDHALSVVGPDHVALGSDLCEGLYTSREVWESRHGAGGAYPEVTGVLGDWYGFDTWYAEGLESVVQFPELARGLLDRGHDETTVRKVLGENFLRVFEAACG